MNAKAKKILSIALAVVIVYAVVGIVYSAVRNDQLAISQSEAASQDRRGRCDRCGAFDWMFSPFGAPKPTVNVGPESFRLQNH